MTVCTEPLNLQRFRIINVVAHDQAWFSSALLTLMELFDVAEFQGSTQNPMSLDFLCISGFPILIRDSCTFSKLAKLFGVVHHQNLEDTLARLLPNLKSLFSANHLKGKPLRFWLT
jgi:hypothetical protein